MITALSINFRIFWFIFAMIIVNLVWSLEQEDLSYPELTKRQLIQVDKKTGEILLKSTIGKKIVSSFLETMNNMVSTTSCRLENKRIVHIDDLNQALQWLLKQGYHLEDREIKDLPPGSKAGTFTFYGSSIKFRESPTLPKTSIKFRIRVYIIDDGIRIIRSPGTETYAFLEIKIKNPFPEYPLSIHKYRLKLPDNDILLLINADPEKRNHFINILKELVLRAHTRDSDNKDEKLIDVMFQQIYILALAESTFIKPAIAITYFRTSKKFDEEYIKKTKAIKCFKPKKIEKKIRTYEITIDDTVRAFYPDFSDSNDSINIEKYFALEGVFYALAQFPSYACIVEFKQPDAIGYDGIGRFKEPEQMEKVQRDLWQAFVGDLLNKTLLKTRLDRGKFAHVKQFIRISNNQARHNDETILF
jgi:hypothetical protein